MKQGMTLTEVIIAVVLVTTLITLGLVGSAGKGPGRVGGWFDSRNRASCQNNLKQIGLVFKMYANESKGEYYPPMMGTVADIVNCDNPARPTVAKGGFIAPGPLVTAIYPEYVSDAYVFRCDSTNDYPNTPFQNPETSENEFLYPCAQPDRGMSMVARSYFYLGWVFDADTCASSTITVDEVTGPLQLAQGMGPLLAPWRKKAATAKNVAALYEDITLPAEGMGNAGQSKIVHRLRDGIERTLITDTQNPAAAARAQSEIMVAGDRPWPTGTRATESKEHWFGHLPGGGNVLFLDGHVEFQKFRKCPDAYGVINDSLATFLVSAFGPETTPN